MRVWIILSLIFLGGVLHAQHKIRQIIPEKTRILFVLDGSGSMEGLWEGKSSRMDVAKSILTKLVDSLKTNPNLELALRVYGHQFDKKLNNCKDTKLEVPFGPKNHNAIITRLKTIVPRGTTPITYSLEQAAKDFPVSPGYRNILILITDGVESCGGDPCAASIEFQKRGIFLRPFIIGLGLESGKVLDCAGKYIDSKDSKDFNQVLNQSIETTFAKTTVSVELLNAQNQPLESNVNISFLTNGAGTSAYEFVHYLDKQRRPDSVQIDPVPAYDLVVNTLPPIIRRNVALTNGKHNVLTVQAAQGDLVVKTEGKGFIFNAIIREKDKHDILNQQQTNETYRYLAGEYEVETITFPRRIFKVTIVPDKLNTVMLPGPGIANIKTITPGYGSLFEIMPDGREVWVCKLDETKAVHAYNLLPGNYRVAFRAKGAPGSKYTAVKTFTITAGKTTGVNVFN